MEEKTKIIDEKQGKITAVITTYKRNSSLVERAIKSVVSQTYNNIELLVVDDNSDNNDSYGIKKIVQKYADQGVKYLTYPGNRGANYARNYGLAHADGEFIAYLDDDDEWLPEKLEKQIAVFTDKDVALVYCRSKAVNDMTGKEKDGDYCIHRGNVYPQLMLKNFIGSASFALLRTSCVRNVGGFDEELLASQDADLWIRLSEKYKIDYVDEILCIYHIHNGERITENPYKRIQGIERINEKNKEYLKKDRETRWIRNMKLTPYYAMNAQLAKALQIWAFCCTTCPQNIGKNIWYLKRILGSYRSYLRTRMK